MASNKKSRYFRVRKLPKNLKDAPIYDIIKQSFVEESKFILEAVKYLRKKQPESSFSPDSISVLEFCQELWGKLALAGEAFEQTIETVVPPELHSIARQWTHFLKASLKQGDLDCQLYGSMNAAKLSGDCEALARKELFPTWEPPNHEPTDPKTGLSKADLAELEKIYIADVKAQRTPIQQNDEPIQRNDDNNNSQSTEADRLKRRIYELEEELASYKKAKQQD